MDGGWWKHLVIGCVAGRLAGMVMLALGVLVCAGAVGPGRPWGTLPLWWLGHTARGLRIVRAAARRNERGMLR